MDSAFYTGNRERMAEKLDDGSVAVFLSGQPQRRAGDQFYPFEVDRNFYYLTGLMQPNLALLTAKKGDIVEHTLILPMLNERMERSNGTCLRPEEAGAISGIAKVGYDSAEQLLLGYLCSGSGRSYNIVYFDTQLSPSLENPHMHALVGAVRINCPYARVKNANPIVNALRYIKQPCEIEAIREAIALTDLGLQNALKHLKGNPEYIVQVEFETPIYRKNTGLGFDTIVAAGANNTTLHHSPGSKECLEGELVLFDVGAHFKYYSADISRTYPVSGKFSPRQRQIYEIVLQMQYECIAMMKAGVPTKEVEDTARGVAVRELLAAGIISTEEEITKYYYHGCCHPLGLFTHDVRPDTEGGLILESGVVCTLEPGLYFADEGFGVRIEDDILILADGNEVLSKSIIKTVAEIEAYLA